MLLILSVSCIQIHAQDLDATFQLGLEQMKMKHYNAASLAFERVLYFGQGKYQTQTLGYLGDMAMSQNKTSQAISYYGRASVAAETLPTKYYYTLRKCSGLLQAKESKLALIELLSVPENIPDSIILYKNFLLGISWFNELDFEESRISFKEALPAHEINKKNSIDSLFVALAAIKHPKPKTAKTLSVIFPGAGQFYAGDIKNGINSLLLTGGFMVLGIHTAIRYTLVDAFGSVLPWFQRYYMGGYKRAERIATERLREKQNAIFLGVIQNFESNP